MSICTYSYIINVYEALQVLKCNRYRVQRSNITKNNTQWAVWPTYHNLLFLRHHVLATWHHLQPWSVSRSSGSHFLKLYRSGLYLHVYLVVRYVCCIFVSLNIIAVWRGSKLSIPFCPWTIARHRRFLVACLGVKGETISRRLWSCLYRRHTSQASPKHFPTCVLEHTAYEQHANVIQNRHDIANW